MIERTASTIACPVCGEHYPDTGAGGVLLHVLSDHRGTAFATRLALVILEHHREGRQS